MKKVKEEEIKSSITLLKRREREFLEHLKVQCFHYLRTMIFMKNQSSQNNQNDKNDQAIIINILYQNQIII